MEKNELLEPVLTDGTMCTRTVMPENENAHRQPHLSHWINLDPQSFVGQILEVMALRLSIFPGTSKSTLDWSIRAATTWLRSSQPGRRRK